MLEEEEEKKVVVMIKARLKVALSTSRVFCNHVLKNMLANFVQPGQNRTIVSS